MCERQNWSISDILEILHKGIELDAFWKFMSILKDFSSFLIPISLSSVFSPHQILS